MLSNLSLDVGLGETSGHRCLPATDSDLFAAVARAVAQARRSVHRGGRRDRGASLGPLSPATPYGRAARRERRAPEESRKRI
jgi:hypothetical protein